MGIFVYALCAVTSLVCCGLLARQYRRSPSPLLLQSAVAFLCFGVSNILLFMDMIVLPQADLRVWRNLTTLAGVVILLIALIEHEAKGQR